MHMDTNRIEKQIVLRAPRSRVWRALTDHEEFGVWFGMTMDRPFQPGVMLSAVITTTQVDPVVAAAQKPYEGTRFEIAVDRMEPETLFSFRWHPFAVDKSVDYSGEPMTLVEFRLEEAEGGVLLKVSESGFDQLPLERRAKAFQSNDNGWGMVIKLVETYLAHGT
ncbi:MAG: SRPBCC family protein [Acidobacteria bacterium]|nr:SRPBCC family protein [Acidobacteriota bacterium]